MAPQTAEGDRAVIDTLQAHGRGGSRPARARRGLRRGARRRLPRGDRGPGPGAARLPPRRRRARRRRPDRAQGRDHDEGHPDDGGLEDPRRLHARLRLDGRRALQGGRPAHPGQDEPGRVRHGLVHRELGLRPDAEPVGSRARAGRLVGRLGSGGRRRARALGARHRHRRLRQAARLALRRRRPAPDLRHGLALRDRRLRLEPRPGRPADEDRPRQRPPVRADRRQGSLRLHDRRAAGARGDPGRRRT